MAQATFAQKAAKTTLFGGLVGGTFSLGCWQTQRYGWKTELLVMRRENLLKARLPLPARRRLGDHALPLRHHGRGTSIHTPMSTLNIKWNR